jgi:hypothetical protein
MADGVLHDWLQDQRGDPHAEHLGGHPQGHVEPLSEPGPFQVQVGLQQPQLLGQRGELPVTAERVPGEVGEADQQLAGPVGVGSHEALDGGQGVVQEVRGDLGPQELQLGARGPGP